MDHEDATSLRRSVTKRGLIASLSSIFALPLSYITRYNGIECVTLKASRGLAHLIAEQPDPPPYAFNSRLSGR